jgi:uncharacterized small protein (DUF1192 family)
MAAKINKVQPEGSRPHHINKNQDASPKLDSSTTASYQERRSRIWSNMAEPFGIVAGAVGIATAFRACIDCFEYIQFSHHFGRDFQTSLLRLDCARLRLTRWGQAVDVYGDHQLGRPQATADEIQIAKHTIFQIITLFEDTEKISKKYRLNAKSADELTTYSVGDMDARIVALHNRMRELAIRRQKGSSFLKTTSWAIHHRSELKQLVDEITVLIDNLESLFPAATDQVRLVKEEAAEILEPQDLQLIEKCAEGVDSLLQDAAKEISTGHQYIKVDIQGQAQVGDAISQNWQGRTAGATHTYDGVTVGKGAKSLLGNKFGGKDFWDD